MDAEMMTADDLMRLANSKRVLANDTSRYREVEVSGVTLTIDLVKLKSWKAFDMVSEIEDDSTTKPLRLRKLIDLVSFVSDRNSDEIIESLGGELVGFETVITFCGDVLEAVDPKN